MHKYLLFLLLVLFLSCESSAPFPPVSTEAYRLQDGFQLEVLAAEPMLDAPVAMCFDLQGRIWVAEMRGYMTDLDNTGEGLPLGRISILEDQNGDGVMDARKIFLDSLVLPRALALVYGGLLYAEPPNLWFVDIKGDQPGVRTLVDSAYATGGNVEHQANGLLYGLDNWIYSAKSAMRYRLKDGQWLHEKTHFRGQWGITQDAFGRLYYNDNSNQLQGDWILPNALLRNPYFTPSTGFNVQICTDQRVYPLQATAVNRGYETGMLDSAGHLRRVTSACGPLIYRGGQFPAEYSGNAFVCVPEANLLKRNVFESAAPRLKAHQALEGQEYLAATDLAFRPVNLYEGPDGCLYAVDMHRGIIQHKTYMTAYLREKLQHAGLDTIAGQGRILRISHTSGPSHAKNALHRASVSDLVDALGAPVPWVRDQARQLLIQGKYPAAVPLLRKRVFAVEDSIQQLQCLWALEGLDALDADLLAQVAEGSKCPWVALTALHLLEHELDTTAIGVVLQTMEVLHQKGDPTLDLALCLYAGPWGSVAPTPVYALLGKLVQQYPKDTFLNEAIVSGLDGQEAAFFEYLKDNDRASLAPYLMQALEKTAQHRQGGQLAGWTKGRSPGKDGLTKGLLLYQSHCSTCHGPTGQGISNLAPPLDESEFVYGNSKKLALIALHGLQGPVTVNGRKYTFNASMQGLGENAACSNADLAAILSFVRNAFSREPRHYNATEIADLRKVKPASNAGFTVGELRRLAPD